MNQDYPSVSVIVPIFNRKCYLAEALESIIKQSIPPYEIIVVDDGSTDGSAEMAQSFPFVRYHFQTNSGVAVARNEGIKLAQGHFLAFLDSDDRWIPNKLERQLSEFQTNPQLDVVFGYVRQFYSPELDEETRQKIRIPQEIISGYHVGAMLIRREAFFKTGFFETHLQCGEFINWYLRAVETARLQIAMLPEVVMERRLHQQNHGRTQNLDRKDYARILKASLDRRRLKGSTC